jgi:hypothetical protein
MNSISHLVHFVALCSEHLPLSCFGFSKKIFDFWNFKNENIRRTDLLCTLFQLLSRTTYYSILAITYVIARIGIDIDLTR